jgi:predicted ATPase
VHAAKAAVGYKGGDPIEPVARDLANDACVLCFDEFQVRFSLGRQVSFRMGPGC